jgi:hypothetical protein
MPVYEMGKTAAELLLKQLTEGIRDVEEIKIKGKLFIRESCGADESQMTRDESSRATTFRRILLNKQPD